MDGLTTAIITASAGFLVGVLWFDLMFDVQIRRYQRRVPPPGVMDSIAAYYRRVTTTASPMGRLVGLVMIALLASLIFQAMSGNAPAWVGFVSLPAALLAVGLAMVRVFPRARRLGSRNDPPDTQAELARTIFREHLVCLAAMVTLLLAQLIAA